MAVSKMILTYKFELIKMKLTIKCALLSIILFSCSKEEDKNPVPITPTSDTPAPTSLTPLEINTTDVINDPEIFNYDVNHNLSTWKELDIE